MDGRRWGWALIFVGALLVVFGIVPFGRVVGAATIVVGVTYLLGAPRAFRRERAVPPPVPAVQEADIADLKEPITACPECGFLGIRSPTIGEGLWPGGGETDARKTCPRCDYLGLPIEFETRADYAAFIQALGARAHATSMT